MFDRYFATVVFVDVSCLAPAKSHKTQKLNDCTKKKGAISPKPGGAIIFCVVPEAFFLLPDHFFGPTFQRTWRNSTWNCSKHSCVAQASANISDDPCENNIYQNVHDVADRFRVKKINNHYAMIGDEP